MNLPNYFLADLPPEAELTPTLLSEACAALKHNRETYLSSRRTAQIIRLVAEAAAGWRHPESVFRALALAHGPEQLGFSRQTLEQGLDRFFAGITETSLNALVQQDLGEAQRLDELVRDALEQKTNRASLVSGPEFLVQIAAGNLPNPTLLGMILGMLTRSAQLIKCPLGKSLLPRLFAHSIYELDPKLASCLEIVEWAGGNEMLESIVFDEADCVTATGSDETLHAIRKRIPSRVHFLGYGHKLSFGYVGSEVLTTFHGGKVITRAAEDVAAWDQLGCLSPHVIYVQTGGGSSPLQFSELLAAELNRREIETPRGSLSPELAAGIAHRREVYQVRAAHSPDTQMWQSKDSTAWTVVLDAEGSFPVSCLHRFIYVHPVVDLEEALRHADPMRRCTSTVGIAVAEHQMGEVAKTLARWGARRVCPLGQMQQPPLTWRHDGRPALADLVKWTDVEL